MTRTRAAAAVLAAAAALLPPALRAQTVDTVVIVRQDVFGGDPVTPAAVGRWADALHVTTRERTIRRQLLLEAGQPFDSARMLETERQLRSLGVFRNVVVDTVYLPHHETTERLALRVRTADGWSTKPEFEFRAAAGDLAWRASMVEENLLGTASKLVVSYAETPDRTGFALGYRNPAFLARRGVFQLDVANLSDGQRGSLSFGVPFLSASSRRAAVMGLFAADDRVLVYRQGLLDTTYTRRSELGAVEVGGALRADNRSFTRLWFRAVGGRHDFALTGSPPPRTPFAAAGAGIELGALHYQVVEGVNSYARREDLDLSERLRLGIWAAPQAWGYTDGHAGVGGEVRAQTGTTVGAVRLGAELDANGIMAGRSLDSGRVAVGATAVAPAGRHTVILHVSAAAAKDPAPDGIYDLWVTRTGPRLFGAHAFTGTQTVWATVEDRILLTHEAFGVVGLGLAPFADWGGAWFEGDPRRLGGDVGLALRLGSTRSTRGDVVEIAAGWRGGPGTTGKHWALAIGTSVRFLAP